MKIKSKILIGTVIALLVVLPLMSTAWAFPAYNGQVKQASMAPAAPMASQEEENERLGRELLRENRRGVAAWFFKEAEKVTIDGEVVTHFRNILVVESEEKRLNILLPPVWGVNSEDKVINISEVFKEKYINATDIVTITALERAVKNDKGVTITIIVAYEIQDETNGNHLYAILPFNIDG